MTGKIPKHWKIKKLGDVLEIFPTASYSRSELSDEGEMQYIHYGDIHTKFDSLLEVTDDILPKISKSKAEKYETIQLGDLVMVDASEDYQGVGKSTEVIALSRYNTIAGLHTFLLRDKGEYFCLGYKGYITMSDYVKKQLYIAATGTKVYSLSKESLKLIQLPIPPLEEQEKIAEILLSCDKAIHLTTQIITQLKQRNQGLAQQLLTGEKNWKKAALKNIAKIEKGEQLNVLNLSNKDKYPSYSGGITPSGYTDKYNTEKDTIIISEGGNSCGYINFIQENFWSGGHCYSIVNSSISKDINKMFLFYFLKKNQEEIMRLRVGSGLPNIQKRDIELFEIEYPSLKEQNAIAQILDTAHQELKLYEQKLQLLQAQKKTLMQKLLTGEVLTIKK